MTVTRQLHSTSDLYVKQGQQVKITNQDNELQIIIVYTLLQKYKYLWEKAEADLEFLNRGAQTCEEVKQPSKGCTCTIHFRSTCVYMNYSICQMQIWGSEKKFTSTNKGGGPPKSALKGTASLQPDRVSQPFL